MFMFNLLNFYPTGNSTHQPGDGSRRSILGGTECVSGATDRFRQPKQKIGLPNLIAFDTITLLSKRPNPRLRKW